MNSIETAFFDYWVQNSGIPIEPQFEPVSKLYQESNSELTITNWKKLNNYTQSVTDFLIANRLCVEIDGAGAFGHQGAGSEDDRRKQSMMLRLGYPTVRFNGVF